MLIAPALPTHSLRPAPGVFSGVLLNALQHLLQAAGLAALSGLAMAPAALAQASPQAAQTTQPAPALSLSADGSMVIDRRAKLAWPRCVEGMEWSGQSCIGSALLLSYGRSQAHAAARAQDEGLRWRLPRVNEFKRLFERSSQPQGLNPDLFPAAPRDWHWTGTASINTQRLNSYNYSQINRSNSVGSLSAQQAWAVNTHTLEAAPDMGKGQLLLVRLVRPATEAELGTTP